jgi:hypothetical protein
VNHAAVRWARLSDVAFQLDALEAPGVAELSAALDTVLEAFDATLDPVEDFEGAAVRRLARSLQGALERVRGATP